MEIAPKVKLNIIGCINTPYKKIADCPPIGAGSARICLIEVFPGFEKALLDVDTCSHLILLYWMHLADRTRQYDKPPPGLTNNKELHGVFATRSPNRPNPIGLAVVTLLSRHRNCLQVTGLDCLDRTSLLDIKPYSAEADCFPEAVIGWWSKSISNS